jgi:hypothetical protein
MDFIISKLEARGNISTRLKHLSAYADDIIVTGRTEQAMIDMFTELKNEASKYGLLINENKTECMNCTRKQVRGNKLEIVFSSELVQSFKYFSSAVNQNNTIEEEIKERIIARNKDFYENQKMPQSKLLSGNSKLKLYRKLMIVTYVSEAENILWKIF